jgi:hypothetical protein
MQSKGKVVECSGACFRYNTFGSFQVLLAMSKVAIPAEIGYKKAVFRVSHEGTPNAKNMRCYYRAK